MSGQTCMVNSALSVPEKHELDQLEASIEKNLAAFMEVGNALLKIRDGKLYRSGFGTFDDYCRDRWGIERTYAHRLIESARAIENVANWQHPPANEAQARPLTRLQPEQQREAWARAVETAPNGKVTAAHVENVVRDFSGLKTCEVCGKTWAADLPFCPYCNLSPEARIHGLEKANEAERLGVHFSSDSPEWYTPAEIIERVVKMLGKIDLDPCSNSHERPNVPAAQHFTQSEDGLAKDWSGRVYMNPPYGREIVRWVERLVEQFRSGEITEAIALVPSRTDTEWFRMLRDFPRCFVAGRLNFSGHENSAPFPSVVVYLGDNLKKFRASFGDVGDIYVLAK